jgi:hypothetical protein
VVDRQLLEWVEVLPVERLHSLQMFPQVVGTEEAVSVAHRQWVLGALPPRFRRVVAVALLRFQLEVVPQRRYLLLALLRYQLAVGVEQQRLQRVVVQLR